MKRKKILWETFLIPVAFTEEEEKAKIKQIITANAIITFELFIFGLLIFFIF